MPNYQAQQLAGLLDNPNVKKFLNLIGWAEGADYNVGYGGRRIDSLAWHPYPQRAFSTSNGKTTSAAGKYQFIRGTWDEDARILGLSDFSPRSQDIAALYEIQKKGALQDVINGNVTSAVLKTKNVWESFVKRPLQSIVAKFNGGIPATSGGASGTINVDFTSPMQKSYDDFNQFVGKGLISNEQRYMLAFAILVLIFIFAFI